MPVIVDKTVFHKYPSKLVKFYKTFNSAQTVFISDRGPTEIHLWTRINPDHVNKYVYTHTIHHNRHDRKVYVQLTDNPVIYPKRNHSVIRTSPSTESFTCITCKYHVNTRCHYYPPLLNGFPTVNTSDWCSKYERTYATGNLT